MGISDAAGGTNYQSIVASPIEVKINPFIVQYSVTVEGTIMFRVASHIFDACWIRDPLSTIYKVQASVSPSEVFQIPQ